LKAWSWNFISDIHIKEPGDKNENLFLSFIEASLNDPNCEKVFLCGDIFDLMIGSFDDYKNKFQKSFLAMKRLVSNGIDLYFIEGNHDFNIKELLEKEFKCEAASSGNFFFSESFFLLERNSKKYLVCHGDTIEIDSGSYPIYKKFITSRFIKILIESILSFNFIESVGIAASKRSRDRGTKAYGQLYDETSIKNKFRKSVVELSKVLDFDVLICGHSHVKDDVLLNEHIRYLNNGYAPISRSYLNIKEHEVQFVNLT
jgi:UDP-2,3-diacylglucosamine hydrolase